jgi:hypothetical protein
MLISMLVIVVWIILNTAGSGLSFLYAREIFKFCSSNYINKNKPRGVWTSLLEQCLTKSKFSGKSRISEKVIGFISFIFSPLDQWGFRFQYLYFNDLIMSLVTLSVNYNTSCWSMLETSKDTIGEVWQETSIHCTVASGKVCKCEWPCTSSFM